MTVCYANSISSGDGITVCFKVLRRWKGSLYKLIIADLIVYLIAYYALSLVYRFALHDDGRRVFEEVVEYCRGAQQSIPISFLLGFFVSGVISRWFLVFPSIPWLNEIAISISTCFNGRDEEEARKLRVAVMRYVNLSWVLLMRLISDQIADRFSFKDPAAVQGREGYHGRKPPRYRINHSAARPWAIDATGAIKPRTGGHYARSTITASPAPTKNSNLDDINNLFLNPYKTDEDHKMTEELRALNNDKCVERTFGKLITEDEIQTFVDIATNSYARTKCKYTPEYWVPIQWAQRVIFNALQAGYITDPKVAFQLIGDLKSVRNHLQNLQVLSSIMIPLAYTQVVTIAVYSYFVCQLFASQFVGRKNGESTSEGDLYVPIFSICSFVFLMGWYRVALCVLNPFGDDDEDFNMSDIFDYNMEVSYRTVVMDQNAFPRHLAFPLEKTNGDEEKTKQLVTYLKQVSREVNGSRCNMDEPDVVHLQIPPTGFDRIKKWLEPRRLSQNWSQQDLRDSISHHSRHSEEK
ncbi:unnamed protein product [Calicophoron daubneyi]|uniref:Bestrophin homolog n=1 Tax=Calicophoron daubneyi TaxID=300641 RepID=A0AAV2TW50_CALDB